MQKLDIMDLDYLEDSSRYFERFRHLPLATFLDSCAMNHQSERSRYDIITALPSDTIAVYENAIVVWEDCLNKKIKYKGIKKPFDMLSTLMKTMKSVENTQLPFSGGIIGYWSYELCGLLEPLRSVSHKSLSNLPLMYTGLFWWALITDHHEKKSSLFFHMDINQKIKKTVLESLHTKCISPKASFRVSKPFSSEINIDQYKQAFDKIQEYILAGDCYEVNLTQKFTANYEGDSWQAYLHLREINPAPFSVFLSYPHMNILSHSPERFLQVKERSVETNPIKGTIKRGKTREEDKINAKLLQCSYKDRTENIMIVDLLRNDLGKVCKAGSVQVPKLFSLESYANVHHLVSTIKGILADDIDIFQLMAHVFPGGSITGAPKVRAMEIIKELEASARSIYCGSVGYASCNQRMDTNIAIRTVVDTGKQLHCWGGGAIVADSLWEQEYEELITKIENLMVALNHYSVGH